MGYQPEERYWTDYLRIALPVVGLLLMLGLFWFWAASLIGDEDDDSPGNVAANTPAATATASLQGVASTEVSGGDTAANGAQPTATTPAAGDGNGAPSDESGTTGEGSDVTPPADGAPPAEESGEGDSGTGDAVVCDIGDFCDGVLAEITSDGVNLRTNPVIDPENVVDQLTTGDEVLVTGDPEEADGIVWIPVETDVGDGYVTSEYLEATG